jgi:hypothetical protein
MALVKRLIGLSVTRQLSVNARTVISVSGMAIAVLTFQHLAASNGVANSWEIIAGSIAIGAVTHPVLAYLMWIFWRKPDGAERQIFDLARATISSAFARSRI